MEIITDFPTVLFPLIFEAPLDTKIRPTPDLIIAELSGWCSSLGIDIKPVLNQEMTWKLVFKGPMIVSPSKPSTSTTGTTSFSTSSSSSTTTASSSSTSGSNIFSNLLQTPWQNTLSEFQWHLLERFSRVSIGVRSKAVQALDNPIAKPILPLLPLPIRTYLQQDPDAAKLIFEYESARDYLMMIGSEMGGLMFGKTNGTGMDSATVQMEKVETEYHIPEGLEVRFIFLLLFLICFFFVLTP